MGTLHIGHEASVHLDDELLEHVFAVLVTKLRRHEPVLLEWLDPDGHTEQMLVNTATLVRAEFEGARSDALDHAWLENLIVAANSNGGICLTTAELARSAGAIPMPQQEPHDQRLRMTRRAH